MKNALLVSDECKGLVSRGLDDVCRACNVVEALQRIRKQVKENKSFTLDDGVFIDVLSDLALQEVAKLINQLCDGLLTLEKTLVQVES